MFVRHFVLVSLLLAAGSEFPAFAQSQRAIHEPAGVEAAAVRAPEDPAIAEARPARAGPGEVPRHSMMAESPYTDYTASAVIYTIILGFLVTVLIAGGILIVNLAMVSKRKEDRIGERSPSEVNVLMGTLWPTEQTYRPVLPAEEEEPPPQEGAA